ncbi:hypothetical protein CBR_g30043 [Chara braunii]|uniref:Uncharacterized protein n=1 Tax=Chara braunii TaxID=69332 RepID=A0A388LBV2_CHABU|nr:hypothetical protein CBR_g30043 [Chara braunii]|eukprot:GBG79781.1 hypothetical protein CBR_g30043 [Chara braunii]
MVPMWVWILIVGCTLAGRGSSSSAFHSFSSSSSSSSLRENLRSRLRLLDLDALDILEEIVSGRDSELITLLRILSAGAASAKLQHRLKKNAYPSSSSYADGDEHYSYGGNDDSETSYGIFSYLSRQLARILNCQANCRCPQTGLKGQPDETELSSSSSSSDSVVAVVSRRRHDLEYAAGSTREKDQNSSGNRNDHLSIPSASHRTTGRPCPSVLGTDTPCSSSGDGSAAAASHSAAPAAAVDGQDEYEDESEDDDEEEEAGGSMDRWREGTEGQQVGMEDNHNRYLKDGNEEEEGRVDGRSGPAPVKFQISYRCCKTRGFKIGIHVQGNAPSADTDVLVLGSSVMSKGGARTVRFGSYCAVDVGLAADFKMVKARYVGNGNYVYSQKWPEKKKGLGPAAGEQQVRCPYLFFQVVFAGKFRGGHCAASQVFY